MAIYTITARVDAARKDSVEKILRTAFKKEEGGEPIVFSVEKKTSPESRADRLSEAESMADDARAIVEELKGEMEEWHESIPENLQNGDKANEVQEAIDALEELQSNLENCSFGDVNFPGMF